MQLKAKPLLWYLKPVVGRQGQQGLLCWPYKKLNCENLFCIDYLGIIFICVMSTKLPRISLVEAELENPTFLEYI